MFQIKSLPKLSSLSQGPFLENTKYKVIDRDRKYAPPPRPAMHGFFPPRRGQGRGLVLPTPPRNESVCVYIIRILFKIKFLAKLQITPSKFGQISIQSSKF